jgi:hypothetical protein
LGVELASQRKLIEAVKYFDQRIDKNPNKLILSGAYSYKGSIIIMINTYSLNKIHILSSSELAMRY